VECYIVKKLDDSPIIKEMVSANNCVWEVIAKLFNISLDVRKEIEDNNENDYISCVDVIHHTFHYDDDLM